MFARRDELPKGILCSKIEQMEMIRAGILLPELCIVRFVVLFSHCSRIFRKGKSCFSLGCIYETVPERLSLGILVFNSCAGKQV